MYKPQIEKKLTKAKIDLMKSHPFFGRLCLLMHFKPEKAVPTAGTDGEHFYYSPEFVGGLTNEQLLGLIAHEVSHVALGHLWRRDKRERHRWNLAADYATNIILVNNHFTLPPRSLFKDAFRKYNTEQIYDKLPKTKHLCLICCGGGGGQPKEKKKSGGEGRGKSKSDKKKESEKKEGKGEGGLSSTEKVCASHRYWKRSERGKNKKKIKQRWEAAVGGALSEAMKTKGYVPVGFERLVDELMPKENWKQILTHYLSTSQTDFDFLKRDRRTLDSPFYLPELSDESALENVVAALDTSGSINSRELNSFVAEIKEILRIFPKTKGWLVDCDCAIGKFVEIEKAKTKKQYYGGGGTSHVPVFEEIKKRKLNPKVVLCFTDLYTEFPSQKPSYPVLWLLTANGSNIKPPFGRVIRLHDARS